MLGMLGTKFCIDLGTNNSIVANRKGDILLAEPTVVAISEDTKKVLAAGGVAKDMLGRTPEDILAIKPLKNGVIADFEMAEIYLRYLLNGVVGKSHFLKPEVIISFPCGATSVESRAILDVAYSVGVKNAYLVPSPLAAAIGAGLPISQPSGNIIVDIGAGITEVAVVSLYGIVVHGSVRVGGNGFDEDILQHIRRKYGLVIGEETAEEVKKSVGNALNLGTEIIMEVRGRDSVSGFPRIAEVSSREVNDCLGRNLERIALCIKEVLEATPPELASDILDKGLVLSGGTSQMKNIDKYISEYIGVPVHVSEDPSICVIKGLSIVLEHLDQFTKSMIRR